MCNLCGRIGHDNRHCTQATKGQEAEYQYGEWLKANGNYSGTQHKVKTKKDDSVVSNGGCEETRSQPPMVVIGNTATNSGGGAQKSSGYQESGKVETWGALGDDGGQHVRRLTTLINGTSLKGVCLVWGKEMLHVSKGKHWTLLK